MLVKHQIILRQQLRPLRTHLQLILRINPLPSSRIHRSTKSILLHLHRTTLIRLTLHMVLTLISTLRIHTRAVGSVRRELNAYAQKWVIHTLPPPLLPRINNYLRLSRMLPLRNSYRRTSHSRMRLPTNPLFPFDSDRIEVKFKAFGESILRNQSEQNSIRLSLSLRRYYVVETLRIVQLVQMTRSFVPLFSRRLWS